MWKRLFLTVVVVAVTGFLVVFLAGVFFPLPQRSMVIKSPVFRNGERIPSKYTCDGENISPPLEWSGAPTGTKSFALMVDDLDARGGVFTHWVIFNIPSSTAGLREDTRPPSFPPGGVVEEETEAAFGMNDFGIIGYSGPCPHSGVNRYVFYLYALDTRLKVLNQTAPASEQALLYTKSSLLVAMEGHILAESELVGLYGRS